MDRTFIQISTLRGRALRLARAAWLAGTLLSLALTAFGGYRWMVAQREQMPAFRALGVAVRDSRGSGGQRTLVAADGPAARAGMRRGVLVAVDGSPVPPGATPRRIAALLRGRPGTAVTLTLRHADGAEARYRLVRQAPAVSATGEGQRAGLLGVVALVYVVALVSVAVLLFIRCPGDPAALTMSMSLALISLGNSLAWQAMRDIPALEPVLRTVVYAGMVLGLWFFCIFPDGRIAPRWTRWWMLVVPAYAAVVEFVAGPRSAPAFYALLTGAMVLGVAAQVQRYRRLSAPAQRQQTKWVVFGVAAAMVLYAAGGLVVPLIPSTAPAWLAWREVAQETLTTWGLLPIPAGLAVSLLRYRLWDADAVLSRSAAYALLTVALAATWAGMSQVAQGMLGGMLGAGSGATAAGLAAALTVALFNPAHDRVRHWADRRFLRDLVEFRERLPIVVGDLRETEDLEGLLAVVLVRVCNALRCGRAAVFLGDEGRVLAAARGVPADAAVDWPDAREDDGPVVQDWRHPVFPVRVRLAAERGGTPVRVGWLALGPRPDGSGYGRDELEALAEVAGPIARAVWIVRARAEREEELERRLQAAEDELRRARIALGAAEAGTAG
ncbi:MAG TPA: PDZ domain-containing protein [Longimicrobium sp.]|nr:PDZ domain-containing protein [Longimicrobium sp.]